MKRRNFIQLTASASALSLLPTEVFAAIASVPFGGIKDSGIGRIHGAEGLLEFTYPRAIVRPMFKIPIAFTTFKRTEFANKFIIKLVKMLYGHKRR